MLVRVLATTAFLIAAAVGVVASVNSWNGTIYIANSKYLQHDRNPAAIRKTFDYSRFDGEPLKVRSLRRLVNDATVVPGEGKVGLRLGHFVTRGDDGRGQFACEYYGRVELVFEAEGVAEFGEKPVMRIEAPCLISQDINTIETIWIPWRRLMKDHKTPRRTIDQVYLEIPGTNYFFENMTAEWPRLWSLVSVRLFSDAEPGRDVIVDKAEISEIIDKPMTVTF